MLSEEVEIRADFNLFTDPVNLTVEDTSTYTEPLANINAVIKATDPNGTVFYENTDLMSPDIDMDVDRTFLIPGLPTFQDLPIAGTYTIEYTVEDGVETETITFTFKYCYVRPVIDLTTTLSCYSGALTSQDTTNYLVEGITPTIVRTHQWIPPAQSGIVTVPTDAVTIIQNYPEVTNKTWTASLSSNATYDFTDGTRVVDVITGTREHIVKCDKNPKKLLDCMINYKNSFATNLGVNLVEANRLIPEVAYVNMLYTQLMVAVQYDCVSQADALYAELAELVNCDCGCEDEDDLPTPITPFNVVQPGFTTILNDYGVAYPPIIDYNDLLNAPSGSSNTVTLAAGSWLTKVDTGTDPINYELDMRILANKMLFVDLVNGTASGVVGRQDKPFDTINRAVLALTADDEAIVVLAGSITESNVLAGISGGVNTVNLYFSQGALLSGTAAHFINVADIDKLNVGGFLGGNASGQNIVYNDGACDVNLEFEDITNHKYAVENTGGASGTQVVTAKRFNGVGPISLSGTVDAVVNGGIYTGHLSLAEGYKIEPGWAGTCDSFVGKNISGRAPTNTLISGSISGVSTGTINIYGKLEDIRDTGGGDATPTTGAVEWYSANINLRGDVTALSAKAINYGVGSLSGVLNAYGLVQSRDQIAVDTRGGGKTAYYRSKVKSVSTVAVSLDGETVTCVYQDCVGNSATQPAILYVSSGSILQANSLKVISAYATSIGGPAGSKVYVIGGMTVNKPLGTTITNETAGVTIELNTDITE